MTTLISFIVVLSILIFIHELGHFLVAKLTGVGVEVFSLGFGPRLTGVKVGETEYRISALPFGGYVKMVGTSLDEELSEEDKKRSFLHKPLLSRTAIVSAGSIMNLLLAVVLFPVIYMIGISVPAYFEREPRIGFVEPEGPAGRAGLRAGDVVEYVNDTAVKTWEDLVGIVAVNPEKTLRFRVRRDGEVVDVEIVPEESRLTGEGVAGIYPVMEPVIGGVSEGYPASQAGIKPGDRIISIDGIPIQHWAELEGIIHRSGEKKVFVVERDGESLTFEITPRFNEEMQVFLVGITPYEPTVVKRYGFFEAVARGIGTSVEMTVKLFVVIKGLITGEYSIKTLGGPIMIAQVAGRAAESGLVDLLFLVAFLSLQLGILNLLPVPVLDGGYLVFFAIEFVRGKPLNEKVVEVAQQIGMVLLVALMLLVTYNDIFRLFGWL